jgi:hypothetical protein
MMWGGVVRSRNRAGAREVMRFGYLRQMDLSMRDGAADIVATRQDEICKFAI